MIKGIKNLDLMGFESIGLDLKNIIEKIKAYRPDASLYIDEMGALCLLTDNERDESGKSPATSSIATSVFIGFISAHESICKVRGLKGQGSTQESVEQADIKGKAIFDIGNFIRERYTQQLYLSFGYRNKGEYAYKLLLACDDLILSLSSYELCNWLSSLMEVQIVGNLFTESWYSWEVYDYAGHVDIPGVARDAIDLKYGKYDREAVKGYRVAERSEDKTTENKDKPNKNSIVEDDDANGLIRPGDFIEDKSRSQIYLALGFRTLKGETFNHFYLQLECHRGTMALSSEGLEKWVKGVLSGDIDGVRFIENYDTGKLLTGYKRIGRTKITDGLEEAVASRYAKTR